MEKLSKAITNKYGIKVLKCLGYKTYGQKAVVENPQSMTIAQIQQKIRTSHSTAGRCVALLEDAGLVTKEYVFPKKHVSLSENFLEVMANAKDAVKFSEESKVKSGKNRSEILDFLNKNPDIPVSEICPEMNRSMVSQELKVLRDAGMVKFRKEGKYRRYWVSEK